MRKLGSLLLRPAICLALVAAAGSVWAEPGVGDETITLGSILPLQSGLAAGATQYRDGADAYFKWVNDNGGINGRKVKWNAVNDSYNPQQAVAAVKKLVDRDGVFAIVGTLGTTNTLAILPFLAQRDVPLFGPLGSHPSINEPKGHNVFPISPMGPLHGSSLTAFAQKQVHAKRIAVFYQDDQYGKELLGGVKEYAAAHDMEVVGTASYVPSDVDMTPQVLALSQSKPDAVIMAVIPKQGALFMIAAQKQGFKSAFFAPQLMSDPVALELGGDALNGMYVNIYAGANEMTTPEIQEAKDILAKYAPRTPTGYWTFIGMSGAKIFTEAARAVGRDLTREALIAKLEEMKTISTGLVPPVNYDPAGHTGPTSFGLGQVVDGKVNIVKDW